MRAAVVERYGSVKEMRIQSLPDPVPGREELLIRVRSIGLNFADVMSRFGVYPGVPKPPFVPGLELAGEVVGTGEDVTGWQVGDRIIGFPGFGSHAELAAVPAAYAMPIPDTMPFTDAAGLMVTYLTAWHALVHLAAARAGETVLVHAAAGGVGTAALQLARVLGLRAAGTAGSAEKCSIALQQGAELAVDYRDEPWDGRVRDAWGDHPVDVILDGVGGPVFRKGWKLLSPMGRYVLFGFSSVTKRGGFSKLRAIKEILRVPWIHPLSLVSANRSLIGFNLSLIPGRRDLLAAAMEKILVLYCDGEIQPYIGAVFPFERINEAHEALQTRRTVGKVVITIDPLPSGRTESRKESA